MSVMAKWYAMVYVLLLGVGAYHGIGCERKHVLLTPHGRHMRVSESEQRPLFVASLDIKTASTFRGEHTRFTGDFATKAS